MGVILAFIVTLLPNGITKLTANDGKAICRADETGPTTITEVYLSKSDKVENWKDCEYGESTHNNESEPARHEDADGVHL